MIQIISKGLAKGLSQWDVDRLVQVTGDATHVHFANQGDSKAPIIDIVEGQAKIPNYLLQSGKTLYAYAVLDGVTLESVSFPVKKKERPENYVYEDDHRNYIYELITDAQRATEDANQATQNANEAADKANQAAKSWAIMGEVKGESMVIDDAIDQTFAGFRIFGKTTQDGVPTPEAPVDLVSVENPTVEVNEQSMLVPYTLRGIPVSSGGNYTDANGQQWICDEVDFGRGVLIKRTATVRFTGAEAWNRSTMGANYTQFLVLTSDAHSVALLCDKLPAITLDERETKNGVVPHTDAHIRVSLNKPNITTNEFNVWIASNPLTIVYPLANATETTLSEEDLAAYASLHTSRYGTTVSNDQNAYMDIHYVMDAKEYIDRKVASSFIYPATIG